MKPKGVDISEHQSRGRNKVYFDVVADNVDFIILREGIRDRIDEQFLNYTEECRSHNIPILGIYHFVCIDTISPEENARSCIKNLRLAGYNIKNTWIFCDIEDYTWTNAGYNLDDVTRKMCTDCAKKFCDTLKNLGCYRVGIYLNKSYYLDYYDWETLEDYKDKLWLADYSDNPPYTSCLVRQDSDDRAIGGFTGTVDSDILYDLTMLDGKKDNVMTVKENALQCMLDFANDNSHGYDQIYRWGERGDYDCSSAVITAWQTAGVPVKTDGATYTGNIKSVFLRNHFKDVTRSVNLATGAGLQPADVLLNEVHHVAMYVGDGREVEASINEKGTATGGKPGDQTGREILVRLYRNYPWDCVLRYVGVEDEEIISDGTDVIDVTVSGSTKMIRRRDTGAAVVTLQTALLSLGYSLSADGEFGRDTEAKVKSFQSNHGLEVDGVVGSMTWAKLYELLTRDVRKLNKVPQYVGQVTATSLNVRSYPSIYFNCIQAYPVLGQGNLVDVCADIVGPSGNLWYYVRIAGHIFGFVSSDYIKRK